MQKPKGVKSPRKQRKMFFNAPAHVRHKSMSAPLSKELAASRGIRSLPVRKGDTVRIMRGDNKGFEGKVSRVALNEYHIYMEGLTREKVDGTNIFLPIHPSKVQIRALKLDDSWRKDILARKKAIEKPEKEEKPKPTAPEEVEEAPAQPEEEVEAVEEETPVQVMPPEEAVPEIEKEEAPAEKTPSAKKAKAKKPAKKEAPEEEEETPEVEEEAQAKKAKAPEPKAAAKKASAPKKASAKKAAPKKTAAKPSAKSAATEETEGGQ